MSSSTASPEAVPSSTLQTPQQASVVTPSAIDENAIYATVANELETGQTDKGLWTRLYVENDGDEKKTKLAYIKQRAEILIADEMGKVQDQLHHYEEKTTRVRELTKILASNTKIRDAVLHLVDYVKGNPGCDTNLKIELVRLLGGAFSWDEGVFTSACTVHLYEQEHKFVKSKDFEQWIVGDVVPLIDVAISSADIAKCPFCGVSVEAGSAVCKNCNRVLDKPKAAPRIKTCPDCGTEVAQDSIACAKCGRVTY